MTITLSPVSIWGVKLALCLPRRRIAMIEARRPRTTPSASIRIHFLSISAGVAENVFMSGKTLCLVFGLDADGPIMARRCDGPVIVSGARGSTHQVANKLFIFSDL